MIDEELCKLNISFCSNESINTEFDIDEINGAIENESSGTDETINKLLISFDESNEFNEIDLLNSPPLERKGITKYFVLNSLCQQSNYKISF